MALTLDYYETLLDENQDYAEVGSLDKARLFLRGLKGFMLLRPNRTGRGSERHEWDARPLELLLRDVQDWIAAYQRRASGGVRILTPVRY